MSLPLVLNSVDLQNALSSADDDGSASLTAVIRVVDLRPAEAFDAGHIPGAVHGDASLLNRSEKPLGGLMPTPEAVDTFLRQIGSEPGDHIVAYDGGRETAAGRLVWVLDAYGYEACSWLNGGFSAWNAAGLPVSQKSPLVNPGTLSLNFIGDNVISVNALKEKLGEDDLSILDVRTEGEYKGTDVRSAFGGHVPGAKHLEWTTMLNDQGKLLDDTIIEAQLSAQGLSNTDTVIVYCQTHQRSAVTYVALKHLGFNDVRAIDGAWSSWGNRDDTPKES